MQVSAHKPFSPSISTTVLHFPGFCTTPKSKDQKRKKMEMKRSWDSLPSLALVNVFRRTSITDRTRNLPLVCPSWAHASRDPRCWASMVPDSSIEYAFIKDSIPYGRLSVDAFGGRQSSDQNRHLGVSRLETLIQRADGGVAVTSLYLYPFLTDMSGPPNDDALLRLIALRCPNLKHFSFYGSYRASDEAILEVIHSCRKLELVDFADSPYFSPLVLEEMGSCCLNVRGIRRNGRLEPSATSALSTSFSGLRLLNLSSIPILDEDLVTIVSGCLGLQYLDVRGCRKFASDLSIIQTASVQISEFFYDRHLVYVDDPKERYFHLDGDTDRVLCLPLQFGCGDFTDDGDEDNDVVTGEEEDDDQGCEDEEEDHSCEDDGDGDGDDDDDNDDDKEDDSCGEEDDDDCCDDSVDDFDADHSDDFDNDNDGSGYDYDDYDYDDDDDE